MADNKVSYPYGHPFWLGKPDRADLFDNGTGFLGLLDAFQSGHVFMNPWKNRPCHSDSYGTIFHYENFDKTFKILTDEYAITNTEWETFATLWIDHINAQPMTTLLGLSIRRKIATKTH